MKKLQATVGFFSMLTACAAQSQSSVTVFGIVDLAVSRVQSTGAGNRVGLANGSSAPSRLGFRGIEDLGVGLSAGYWLEGALDADAGNVNGFTFQRRSTISLYSSYGEIRLGRDMVPSYLNLLAFDPFTVRGVGQFQGYNNFGFSTIRVSNSIGYLLPKNLGGFYGHIQYSMGEKASTTANDKQGNAYGGRLGFEKGPLNVAIAYNHWKQVIGASDVAPITFGRDVTVANIGLMYDLGPAKLTGIYGREESENAVANNSKLNSMMVGTIVPIGVGEFKFSYSKYNLANSANDFSKISIGYQHSLSKRTTVYTTASQLKNDGAAVRTIALDGLGALVPTTGGKSRGVEFGVRHVF